MYLPLVRSLARRYASRGEHFDDLVQVGAIGLIKAIDRFDLSRGVELTTYATPNIVGEIKRYFRDKGWSVRVPRGLQELNIRLNKVIDELVPKLQRSPTINELAEAANATPEEVLEALETSQAYNSVSLQASPNGESGEEDAGLIDYLGGEEEAYDTMEDRTTLAPGFAKLDKRERYILHLRFFEGLTQSQIAERVGISQMHVSRLIRRSLEKLREEIAADGARSRRGERRRPSSGVQDQRDGVLEREREPLVPPVVAVLGAGRAEIPVQQGRPECDRRVVEAGGCEGGVGRPGQSQRLGCTAAGGGDDRSPLELGAVSKLPRGPPARASSPTSAAASASPG